MGESCSRQAAVYNGLYAPIDSFSHFQSIINSLPLDQLNHRMCFYCCFLLPSLWSVAFATGSKRHRSPAWVRPATRRTRAGSNVDRRNIVFPKSAPQVRRRCLQNRITSARYFFLDQSGCNTCWPVLRWRKQRRDIFCWTCWWGINVLLPVLSRWDIQSLIYLDV